MPAIACNRCLTMDLQLDAISRIRERANPDTFNLNYLLSRVRQDMNQRVADAKWQGGEMALVDFKEGPELPPGTANPHFLPAHGYFGDTEKWPANPETLLDGLVLNLFPSWFGFERTLRYFPSLIRSGGLFAFSAFGPDTLREIEHAWRGVDDRPHVHPFLDMHHLGDMMMQAGLKNPIVDAQWITVEYPDYATLVRDLRYSGFGNVHAARRKTLTGKSRHRAFLDALQAQNDHAQRIRVTFEIVYGLGFRQTADASDRPGQVLVDPPA